MKLHLPCTLLAAVLACCCAVCSHASATESLSINFGADKDTIDNANTAGLVAVEGSHWNQVERNKGSSTTLKTYDSVTQTESASAASLTWSCVTTYQTKITPANGNSQMLYGYLDDSNISITLSGIDYLTYDLYIYAATDTNNATFAASTVNGQQYTYKDGSTTTGSETWGDSDERSTLAEGANALYLSDQSASKLTITNNKVSNSVRGCIAGLQIVNTYEGSRTAATLAATADWTESALGSTTWVDSREGAQTYASLTLTEDATLTISGTDGVRDTDALFVTGGNLTITGGTLNLTNVGRISAADGTKVTIDSDVTGMLDVASGHVQLNGTATLDSISGGGELTVDDNATVTVASGSFSGTLNAAADKYNAMDAGVHGATTINLSGEGNKTINYTTQNGHWAAINYEGGTLSYGTVTSIGDGSFAGGNSASISKLDIVDGTLSMQGSTTYNNIASVHVHDGATLMLQYWTNLACPDILLEGGGTIDANEAATTNFGATGGTITIAAGDIVNSTDASNKAAVIKGLTKGNISFLSNIEGTGTLQFEKSRGTNTMYLKGSISDGDGGVLSIRQISGTTQFEHAENSYSGNTHLEGGTMYVAASNALGDGTVTVKGGSLEVKGSRTLDNNIYVKDVDGNAVATFAGQADATFADTSLTNSGITGGTVSNSDLTVKGTFSTNTSFENSTVEVATGGTLNVTGGTLGDAGVEVTGGALNVSVADALGNGKLTVTGGSALISKGNTNRTAATEISGGTVTLGDSHALGESSQVTVKGTGALTTNGHHKVRNTILACAADGTLNATLSDAGTGVNGGSTQHGATITGTGISSGTIYDSDLKVAGTFSISDTTLTSVNVEVQNGGVLTLTAGSNTLNNVVVQAGGKLNAATDATLTLTGTVTTSVSLKGLTALQTRSGNSYDAFTFDTLSGTTFAEDTMLLVDTLTLGEHWDASQEDDLRVAISFSGIKGLENQNVSNFTLGAGNSAATLDSVALDATAGTVTYYITVPGTGSSEAVPEPTTATLSLLALAALAARRRRKA